MKVRIAAKGAWAIVLTLGMLPWSCGGGSDNPPTPSSLQALVRDGDVLPGGFTIATIESANMSRDRSIAMIVSQPGSPTLNSVFLRRPGGEIEPILTSSSGLTEGLSLSVVRNMAMSQTGEFAFEVGDRLDSDAAFFFDGQNLHTVARTEPGTTPGGFRLLGELRVADGGLVAFSDGTSPCTVDTSGGAERITCDLRIFTGRAGTVQQVSVPNELTERQPSDIILQVNARQEVAVGLPARGSEPLLGVIRNGQFEGVLNRRQVIGGLGEILAARPRGISSTGAIACDGGFDQDGDGERDITRAFLFHNGTLSTVAETGGTFEGNPETDVRAVGVDSANRVIYTMTFESGEEELISLRAWEAGQTSFIAHEGLDFGQDADGMDQRILELEQVRVSQGGDVLFVVTLGRFEQGTRRITGTRLMRWNGGALETVLQTDAQVSGGRLVGFSIADVNDVGDVLLIGEIDRRANRALLLLPR